jgi:hypothetical protein
MNTSKKPRRMARPPHDGDGQDIHCDAMGATDPIVTAPVEKRVTKLSLVLGLLHQEGGASLAAIVEATGWLPHTCRAALTGLRKKGHAIVRDKVDGVTRYSIAAGEPARKSLVLTPGTRLIREWNGKTIAVEVREGGFVWADRTYRSLSEIARQVTGAHWSGPRFFGLTRRG